MDTVFVISLHPSQKNAQPEMMLHFESCHWKKKIPLFSGGKINKSAIQIYLGRSNSKFLIYFF